MANNYKLPLYNKMIWRRGWDSNPRYACAHNGFRDRPVRPLRHPSAGGGPYRTDPKVGKARTVVHRAAQFFKPTRGAAVGAIDRASLLAIGFNPVYGRYM